MLRTPCASSMGAPMRTGLDDVVRILEKAKAIRLLSERRWMHLIKAVAVPELKFQAASPQKICGIDMGICTNSDHHGLQSSDYPSSEMDDKEKLRRTRISKANKGNVPWNKGRKHTPETIQRIKEKTRIAMQNPKVKMKLANLGHAQSKDTRMKIGIGVREGWQRRRQKLKLQEGCLFEWQDIVAEAARSGFAVGIELQWDSYSLLDGQLMEEWIESVEKRKVMRRPAGSKRAPKSADQRRKISAAISAKWADPAYRQRVCAGLSKYHNTAVGEKQRRPKAVKKISEPREIKGEARITKSSPPKKKKISAPSYRDPMASAKLEMIKELRGQRAALGEQKREAIEATERAKLLIAEAEKAAKALEVAALDNPLAQAALLQTRKLIAEAVRSIEVIEGVQVACQDPNSSVDSYTSEERNTLSSTADPGNGHVNGVHMFSKDGADKGPIFGEAVLQTAPDDTLPPQPSNHYGCSPEAKHQQPPAVVSLEHLPAHSVAMRCPENGTAVSGLASYAEDEIPDSKIPKLSADAAGAKMKWVRGRLVREEDCC